MDTIMALILLSEKGREDILPLPLVVRLRSLALQLYCNLHNGLIRWEGHQLSCYKTKFR